MTVSNWKMIDAVMYGMMPRANTVSVRRLPPANRSSRPSEEPEFWLKKCASASALMPGVGMCAPRRYTASMASVNPMRLRRSLILKMLRNFSSISVKPQSTKRPEALGSGPFGRAALDDASNGRLELSCRSFNRCADDDRFTAGGFDLLLRGLG